jgi:hypothetical protein
MDMQFWYNFVIYMYGVVIKMMELYGRIHIHSRFDLPHHLLLFSVAASVVVRVHVLVVGFEYDVVVAAVNVDENCNYNCSDPDL